jgi:amidophosphoribosyltransferase
VRYPTAGAGGASESQPFYVNAPYGIVLGHNGNLTNASELSEVLIREERRHLNTTSDSEVLLNVLASELQRVGTPRVTAADVFAAVTALYRRCRGGYAVVAMVIGHGILGFRDPNGIRPLILGSRETPKGLEYMLASESVALDMLGFKTLRDIAPGEAVFIDEAGRLNTQQCSRPWATRPAFSSMCISPDPTALSTTCRCSALACAWVIDWPTRSVAFVPTTTSTS